MSKIVNILHLSDLHFGMEKSERIPPTAVDQRNLTMKGLVKTLKQVEEEWRPQVVAITGDIAWKGRADDYQKAKEWLTNELLQELKLSPDKLVICPGNHDIDRGEAIGIVPPLSTSKADEWLKLEHIQRFSHPFHAFATFCKDMMGISPIAIGDQPNVLTGKIDLEGLRFVVLNSAWFCSEDEDHKNKLWLGKPMLEKMAANDQLLDEEKYDKNESPVVIALFHHPYEWLNEKEASTYENRQSTMEYLSLRSHIILTGHIHARPSNPHRHFDWAWLVKGGTSYAGDQYRNHFSILRVNTEERNFERLVFEFDPGKNKWQKEKQNVFSLKIQQAGVTSARLIIPGKYKEWIYTQCQDMDITQLAEATDAIHVRLPEIYIPLLANPLQKTDEKQEPVDIEDLIVENRFLVIKGRAGSGKTTLAKHVAYMMIKNPEWKGLDGYLPVLIFLKDLKGFDAEGLSGNCEMAEKMLAFWAEKAGSFLDMDIIRGFCETGKVVFLLDGLDEIDAALRELIVTSFNGVRIKHEDCKIVLSGRPHGVDNGVTKYFGQPVEILSLLMPQVEDFIHRWFQFFDKTKSEESPKTAKEMIGEVKSHASVRELIDSPLMLTAICLLFNSSRKLPDQRAELYDRFVTNLLFKRFGGEDRKVRNFLMQLAAEMHILKRSKNIDRVDAVRILKNEYKREEEETPKKYNNRMDEKFGQIEPSCGLLKLEKSGYSFFHLTFQEFLAASELAAGETGSHFDTIRQYWDEEWFQEMIQLYIGYLSIQSPAMANTIIQRILQEKDHKTFTRSRLAVRSLIDIHKDKRKDDVVQSSRDCLWEIIISKLESPIRAEAGELLGRLGDERNLEEFVLLPDGSYKTSVGKVRLEQFEITKYLVTNRWYRKFVEDDGYNRMEFWSKAGKKWLKEGQIGHPEYWFDHKWNCDNHPVVGVSWYEADAFCRWLTESRKDGFLYRLPDEKEWEAAAGGKDGREYPWGDGFDKNKCNTNESKIRRTSAVGIFQEGDTPNGLSDMAGNVWEWTITNREKRSNQFDFKNFERVVIRGGSWLFNSDSARCADRSDGDPYFRLNGLGFRCSRIKG